MVSPTGKTGKKKEAAKRSKKSKTEMPNKEQAKQEKKRCAKRCTRRCVKSTAFIGLTIERQTKSRRKTDNGKRKRTGMRLGTSVSVLFI